MKINKNYICKILLLIFFFILIFSTRLVAQEDNSEIFDNFSYVSKGDICLSIFLGNLLSFNFGFGLDIILQDFELNKINTDAGLSFRVSLQDNFFIEGSYDLIISTCLSFYYGLLRGQENTIGIGISIVLNSINNSYIGFFALYNYKIYLTNKLAIFLEIFSIYIDEVVYYFNVNIGFLFIV